MRTYHWLIPLLLALTLLDVCLCQASQASSTASPRSQQMAQQCSSTSRADLYEKY